ncbi:hypothetical protein GCM10009663_69680 [Kitasatospora arboriphila]|uniref:Uncharacterized protein n=1 Tax=Kitasatospora arboriphila TaxID=258052 RepID=A0ABN1U4Y4_9ACTN
MHRLAVRDGQQVLADGIAHLFGRAECPVCACLYTVADEYSAANRPVVRQGVSSRVYGCLMGLGEVRDPDADTARTVGEPDSPGAPVPDCAVLPPAFGREVPPRAPDACVDAAGPGTAPTPSPGSVRRPGRPPRQSGPRPPTPGADAAGSAVLSGPDEGSGPWTDRQDCFTGASTVPHTGRSPGGPKVPPTGPAAAPPTGRRSPAG